jgi:hypothetical protein
MQISFLNGGRLQPGLNAFFFRASGNNGLAEKLRRDVSMS